VVAHLTETALLAGLDDVRLSPAHDGRVELIVRRPAEDERQELDEAELDPDEGLVGDSWRVRALRRSPGTAPPTGRQLTLMNARVAALVAGGPARRGLAGDQLYLDFDLSVANLPTGTRVAIGPTVVEVTEHPHLGCAKFAARFGPGALALVNCPEGRRLRLRGLNARILLGGTVRVGDAVGKVAAEG
jgi:hypothetical protein